MRRPRQPQAGSGTPTALVTETAPKSAAAEAYRTLRTNIQFAGLDRPCKTIVITSATPGGGKTTAEAARRAAEQIDAVKGRILGVLLNRVDARNSGYYADHGRYYDAYYGSDHKG